MKGRAIIPLVLGLCVGLVAVKYLVKTLQNAQGSSGESQTVSVVRATQDLDSYQEITAEFVELVETTDDTFAPSQERITSLEDVIGRVTAKAIPERAPILLSMLAPPNTPAGMVGRIPPGFRAVSVKIDEVTGVAYQLKPGSWVDVIVVMDIMTGSGRNAKETIAEVILQHVQVAAIGRTASGPAAGRGSKMKPAKSATLLVAEKDVPKLHLAGTRGKLTLAMRGEDKRTTEKPLTARESEVFSYGEKRGPIENAVASATSPRAQPMPIVEPPFSVVVYRGSTEGNALLVEQTTFESAQSRTIIGIGGGPVSRMGRSRLDDEWGPVRSSRPSDDRTGRQKSQDVPNFDNMEAE